MRPHFAFSALFFWDPPDRMYFYLSCSASMCMHDHRSAFLPTGASFEGLSASEPFLLVIRFGVLCFCHGWVRVCVGACHTGRRFGAKFIRHAFPPRRRRDYLCKWGGWATAGQRATRRDGQAERRGPDEERDLWRQRGGAGGSSPHRREATRMQRSRTRTPRKSRPSSYFESPLPPTLLSHKVKYIPESS